MDKLLTQGVKRIGKDYVVKKEDKLSDVELLVSDVVGKHGVRFHISHLFKRQNKSMKAMMVEVLNAFKLFLRIF